MRYRKLQLDMLNKLHETDFDVDMDLNLWHPDRKYIDYLFSLNSFIISPNEQSDTICTFKVKGAEDIVDITIFCNKEDAKYLQKKIREKGGDKK